MRAWRKFDSFSVKFESKFNHPAFLRRKTQNLSAEILQILGLNLARKFDVGLLNPHKFNVNN